MLSVDIEFNEACNASCVYCPVSINPRQKNNFMSEQNSDLLFYKLSQQNINIISFSIFNEPLLDPLFKTRINQLRKYKLYKKLNLHTNGILITKDITNFLLNRDLSEVVFNIASLDEDEWSKYMGVHKKLYKKTIDNILYFITLHSNVNIRLQPLNYTKAQHLYNYFSKYNPNIKIDIAPKVNQGGSIDNKYVDQPKSNKNFLHTRCKYNKLLNSLTINYDGSCRLCCKDFHKKYTLGNILIDSIENIMTSNKSKELINQIYGSNKKDSNLLCNKCTDFERIL